MSEQTPPPWKAVQYELRFPDRDPVPYWEVVGPADADPSEQYAVTDDLTCEQAHLMAAAPDLLRACEMALVSLEQESREHSSVGLPMRVYPHTQAALRDAIAKARGEAQP